MSTRAPHLIEDLQFAVAFQTQALAFEQQECLAHFASKAALRIIDEVFDAHTVPGRVMRLEQLTVDLGAVQGSDLEQQWGQRLRRQLQEALEDLVGQPSTAMGAESCSIEHAAFEAFWYFLQHGRLPWYGRNGDADALVALAHEVASHSGERLGQALRRAGSGSIALRRLVLQLPAPALAEFVGRWLGQGSEVALAIERVITLCAVRGISELARSPLRVALWEAALARLLGSPVQPSDAVIATLAAVLADGNHEAAPVIATLRAASPEMALHLLRAQVRDGLLHDPGSIAESTWEVLLQQDTAWLRTTLAMLGCSARVRRSLVVSLAPARLWTLAALWLPPEERDFVHALVDCPALRASRSPQGDFDGWGCTFTYLWTDVQSGYSRQDYAAHLLRQLQATDAAALGRLQHWLLRAHAGNAVERALHALLGAALAQVAAREPYARTQLLQPRLIAALESAAPTEQLAPILEVLLRQDAAFVREALQRADLATLERVLRAASADQQRALLELWLGPSDCDLVVMLLSSAHLQGLMQCCDGASTQARCWAHVLSYLGSASQPFELRECMDSLLLQLVVARALDPVQVSRRWLAFAERASVADHISRQLLQRVRVLARSLLTGLAPARAGATVTQHQPPVLTESTRTDPAHGQESVATLRARLAAQLCSGGPVEALVAVPSARRIGIEHEWTWRLRLETALATESCGTPPMWQALLGNDAIWLKQALRRLGRSASVRRTLALGLPEACLQDIATLWLPPREQHVLGSLLAHHILLEHAAPRQLWEFTLGTLLLAGSADPSATTMVHGVLQQLATHVAVDCSALIERLQVAARDAGDTPLLQALMSGPRLRPAAAVESNDSESAVRQPDCLPALLEWLRSATGTAEAALAAQVSSLCARQEPHARRALLLALDSTQACERLIQLLAEQQLQQVLQLLQPWDHLAIRSTASAIVAASRAAGSHASVAQYQRWSWQFILRECCEQDRVFEPAGFAVRFVAQLTHWVAPADPQQWRRQLLQRLPSSEAHTAITASLETAHNLQQIEYCCDRSSEPGPIYIANAGLVLACAYLPRLFAMLNLTDEGGFLDAAAAQRAVQLSQYVVTGVAATPEHQLVLNKLLCGKALDEPVSRSIEVQPREHEAITGMLRAMIQHWKILGSTSVAGLRETFLQREGQLTRRDDHWQLLVEPRPFDMLLDQLPWGYSTVKFPWMPQVMHVDWR